MTTIYSLYIIKSQFCDISYISVAVLTHSTFLSPYYIFSSYMEPTGVEYSFDLMRPYNKK